MIATYVRAQTAWHLTHFTLQIQVVPGHAILEELIHFSSAIGWSGLKQQAEETSGSGDRADVQQKRGAAVNLPPSCAIFILKYHHEKKLLKMSAAEKGNFSGHVT
ncbi:hypothetical protein RRG08_004088 [Elysia crispata]|uniref:Uncharacterized protein n=1 Tax=Elysia crispata TaxID=231223 RepID=A0AAE1D944_9GAST|nr:hypothetical protein RRG08_004088 [Elysia crispata]